MGGKNSGPNQKPMALKKLEGHPRTLRKSNHNQPEPYGVFGDAPEYLGEHATDFWNDHVPALNVMGMLSVTDRPAFIQLCMLAEVIILKYREEGKIAASTTIASYKGFLVQFGMTPSSRNSVSVEKRAEKKDDYAFIDNVTSIEKKA